MPRHSAPQRPSRVKPRVVVTAVVAAAGLATAVWLPTRSDSADAAERGNRNNDSRRSAPLDAFDDDFAGRAGDTASGERWASFTGDRRGSDRQARLDGRGNLLLTARESGSDKIVTRDTFQLGSGRLEARIAVPDSGGLQPALQVITGARNGGSINLLDGAAPGDFHTYEVTWAPGKLTTAVDGKQTGTFTNVRTDAQFALALSLTVTDGNAAQLPATMAVDFVRIVPEGAEQGEGTPSGEPSAQPTGTTPNPAPDPTTASPSPSPSDNPTEATPTPAAWEAFVLYDAGDLVTYEGSTYQVLETHTSLPGWEPTALPALFEKI